MRRITQRLMAGLAIVATTGAISVPVFASQKGNTVLNCYGVYYNTDWDQTCGPGGAQEAGRYKSIGDCTAEPDNSLTVNRYEGSRETIDGGDCRIEVANVRTSFLG